MKIICNESMSIFDLMLTINGSIDNIYTEMIKYNITDIQQDITNQEFDVIFSQNQFSQNNKLTNYKVSCKDEVAFTEITTGAFSDGFNEGFDI